ncbi:DUF6090 family protein [Thalassobellus suaedae]|uniref:DUF6090 family protein n=1 Tax=Thalassobellus suaedae TaxID=3074124 RepID=A0ABY9Y4M7_9FLAO|nr:DUF6090 family protein [Flavobacteriaceae bacterium HL-DH10]
MIKFFRKIRQKMLTENKFSKYLLYAIGEIVLVVIGILIALQINNWNEKQKLAEKTQEYYGQLLDDLKSDIKFSKHYLEESSIYLNEYNIYTKAYNKEVLNPIQFYEQISKLDLETPPLTFNTNTIESLQSTGDIGLIPSNIRNRLIDLKRLQTLSIKRFEDTDDGKSEITQNLSRLLGSTTLPKRLENQPKMKEFLNIDENLRMLILVYEGIHRWKYLSLKETKGRLEEMQKEINSIIELINKKLKK